MDKIFQIFSNREIALLFWAIAILVFLMVYDTPRKSFIDVVKIIFGTPVLIIINILVLDYTLLMIDFLQRVQFWDESLIKDTIIWLLGTGIVMTYYSINFRQVDDFKKVLIDLVKWTIILEFLVNFYNFNLLTEILLLPILVFLGMIQASSELYPNYKKLESFYKSASAVVGLTILSYAIFWAFIHPELLFTISNLKSFLLPILLTIIFVPFVYLVKLYAEYELLLIRLPFLIYDDKYRKAVKKQIFLVANFNLATLLKISGGLAKLILVDESRSLEDIKKISK